jgi:hypothetical protein
MNTSEQAKVCSKFNADYEPIEPDSKLGVAMNVRSDLRPINGLRHPPKGDTSGWYLWAGEELSGSPDFFQPLHAAHISEWNSMVEKYLALPPGWRFIVAEDYEDVWFDATLLDVDA